MTHAYRILIHILVGMLWEKRAELNFWKTDNLCACVRRFIHERERLLHVLGQVHRE